MRRKPRRSNTEEHDNHERWLISYADFITLLFAFFVVMYAISSVSESKYRMLSQSIVDAFGKEASSRPLLTAAPPPANPEARLEEEGMADVAAAIRAAMAPLVKEGQVRITRGRRGVSVEIKVHRVFPGKASLIFRKK